MRKRECLAKAITLVESSNPNHREQAKFLLEYVASKRINMKHAAGRVHSLRLGIAGPPGAGKSTFIEKLGKRYVNESHRVAVIPVDPSSHISGGSILGDKTRMEVLSKSDKAYVRASPTRGVLGGVAEHTVDVITLCEAADFDTVIVESVGLGQSEVEIDAAVDMLILLVPPGGGDSLQAAKKGIVEAADLIVVNKADGNLLDSARHTKADYSSSMQLVRRKYEEWKPHVMLISAHNEVNIDKVQEEIEKFHAYMVESGNLQRKRNSQAQMWMLAHFRRTLFAQISQDSTMRCNVADAIKELNGGHLVPRAAAEKLIASLNYKVVRDENWKPVH